MNEEFRDSFARFLSNVAGPALPANAALIAFASMPATFQDFCEFMQSLGGDFDPGYVNHSKLSESQVANIMNFSKSNPVMHNLMLNTAPHYAALYNTAKLDEEIQRLPDSAGNRMKVEDAVKFMGGLPGYAAFNLPRQVAGFAEHVGDQVDSFKVDLADKLDMLKSIYEILLDVVRILKEDIWPLFKQYMDLFGHLAPALEEINDVVLKPYATACRNAKIHMDQEIQRLENARMSVDSAVPPIVGPNYDAKRLSALAMGYNLPILGSMFRGQLSADLLDQYQAMHKRGFITDLDFHRIAAFGGVANPLATGFDIASRVPDWFIRN